MGLLRMGSQKHLAKCDQNIVHEEKKSSKKYQPQTQCNCIVSVP